MEDHIFQFHDVDALQHQDNALCDALYADFWTRTSSSHLFDYCKGGSQLKQSFPPLKWYATYAAVTIVRPLDSIHSTISLVGLDGWKSCVHASVNGRVYTALPDYCHPVEYHLGYTVTKLINPMLATVDSLVKKSEAENRRRQTTGRYGNQKTPSFIHAMMQKVLQSEGEALPVIQGGTTDVGLHTGCIRRNTSFPLVLSALCVMLRMEGQPNDDMFCTCVIVYFMSYLKETASLISSFDKRMINRVMVITREIEKWTLKIGNNEFLASVVSEIEIHQKRLLSFRPVSIDNSYLLEGDIENVLSNSMNPSFPKIYEVSLACDIQSKIMRAKAQAVKNLVWSDLSTYTDTGKIHDAWVHISRLNSFFCKIASELEDDIATHNVCELRRTLSHFSKQVTLVRKKLRDTSGVMSVVLLSSEMLAAWVCYCWSHRVAETEYPVFVQFGSALDPHDLKHLVLRDKRAIEAVEHVRKYLEVRFRRSKHVFRKVSETLELALVIGMSSSALKDMNENEHIAAEKLVDNRWCKIKKTQIALQDLDEKLRLANRALVLANDDLKLKESLVNKPRLANRSLGLANDDLKKYFSSRRKRDSCQQEVHHLEKEISCLEILPHDMVLGLPKCNSLSLRWLFFLYMPTDFRNLSALAQLAQSMLWTSAPVSEATHRSLLAWYRSNQKSSSGSPVEGKLCLGSNSKIAKVPRTGIRNYSRETGVHYPDAFELLPHWLGFDLFALGPKESDTVILFTENLPTSVDKSASMQTYVSMLSSPLRENQVIASRENRPVWLSHEQFMVFGHLRAGPHSQIRALTEALFDDLLPFHHDCVHILVKQLLFQVGEPGWKLDLKPPWNGYRLLASDLKRRVDLLRSAPKDCNQLLLFGIVSSFLGQFNDECKECVNKFSRIARSWADDVVQEEIDEAMKIGRVSSALYWKQAKFYGYALLCYGVGELKDSDLLEVAELIVLYRSKVLLSSKDPDSQTLHHSVAQLMSHRVLALVQLCLRHPEHLTNCCLLLLDDIPENVFWDKLVSGNSVETGCFEAVAENQLYTINLLDGMILVDGEPPGLLPSSVVENPLYRRTFGERNFEIVVLGFRHYRASRRVQDCYLYEFMIDKNDQLQIYEHDFSNGKDERTTLRLIPNADCSLPPLILNQHSLWFSKDLSVFVLRGQHFQDRVIRYAVTRQATYVVPKNTSVSKFACVESRLDTYDQLLLWNKCHAVEALNGLEYKEYVHVDVNFDHTQVRISLPRFKLSFLLRGGRVESEQFKGYFVQPREVYADTIPGFTAFVALTNTCGAQKLLISEGSIGTNAALTVSRDLTTNIRYHIFYVHPRFGYINCVDRNGRLQLACLYASSGCLLPDRRLGKQGSVIATELVRQSWTNEPLSDAERKKLIEISDQSALSCVLNLMCTWLWKSSQSLGFLYDIAVDHRTDSKLKLSSLAQDEYHWTIKSTPRLLFCEETSLFGIQKPQTTPIDRSTLPQFETLSFVQTADDLLKSKIKRALNGEFRKYPLNRPDLTSELEILFFHDIDKSFQALNNVPLSTVDQVEPKAFRNLLKEVRDRCYSKEIHILERLRAGDGSPRNHLSLLSGSKQVATCFDILRIVADESIVIGYNPNLGDQERVELACDCISWAMLCVLEDKLQRIENSSCKDSLLVELGCVRKWNPILHPRWLAFEVEMQLQIRPNQYSIVEQLLSCPGSVIQLNMGLGKTRVLVPMLILDAMSRGRLGRVNVLPAIYSEAIAYYRNVLGASSQTIKIFSLPFHRGILLDGGQAERISDEILACQRHLGCFVVTPQHRNSLLLKQHEHGTFVTGLSKQFIDIIDESDAILHHQFQLVYAIGNQEPLPSASSRWTVLQALVTALVRSKSTDIEKFTLNSQYVYRENVECGAFPKIRLLLPFKGHEANLSQALCRALLYEPPFELRWMKRVQAADRSVLVSIMADTKLRGVMDLIENCVLFKQNQSDILALRGYIACGLLFHGLESRNSVNFGVDPHTEGNMAVPYSASGTPKHRAQYSHPDMELVYTMLAHYHDGISMEQLKSTLSFLQSLGLITQKKVYAEWIQSVREDISANILSTFDDIRKVDMSNQVQLKVIHEHLRNCMDVISFWTKHLVFPYETHQFRFRRATSAWNLSDSMMAIGFSGTDDNRFLLPNSIQQIVPEEEHLRATNAEMLLRILECTKNLHMLYDATVPTPQAVLNSCLQLGVEALIDVAGLMAGLDNRKAAVFMARNGKYPGVMFFDIKSDTWMVFDRDNDESISLASSSLTTLECFVYFDESRCRGVHMDLKHDAVALVTLEPRMTKDKFLQGCARMRKLKPSGQTLILAGTAESMNMDSTVRTVLESIMGNTINAVKKGLLQYFQRGIDFYSFPRPLESDFSLDAMYAKDIPEYRDLGHFLESWYDHTEVTDNVRGLVDRCSILGRGISGAELGSCDEECEQELEQEEECLEDAEIEIEKHNPCRQVDWQFETAFSNPEVLFWTLFIPLNEFLRSHVRRLSVIAFSANIYCTANFWKTISSSMVNTDHSLFLRPVNAFLSIADGSGRIVLVSAYELDKLLPIWWSVSNRDPKSILCQLCTCTRGTGFGRDSVALSDCVSSSVKLFRGYVEFSAAEKVILLKIFGNLREPQTTIQELLSLRSRSALFHRSDLDEICSADSN